MLDRVIDYRHVGVEITWVASPADNLFSGGTDLAESSPLPGTVACSANWAVTWPCYRPAPVNRRNYGLYV